LTSPSANFSVSAPDGLTSVKIGGVAIYNGISFSPVDVVTLLGVLHITGFSGDASGGTFTYTYTLHENALINGSQSFDNLNVEVQDRNGSLGSDLLSVKILDDAPLLNITNGIAQNSTDTSVYGTLANMGADQEGAHISLSVGSMPSGLSSGGVALTYTTSSDGSMITAKAGANTVFTLTAASDGTYIYHQVASLDLTILSTNLQSSVGAGGPQPAYYFYTVF
jgi:hypothetical protein